MGLDVGSWPRALPTAQEDLGHSWGRLGLGPYCHTFSGCARALLWTFLGLLGTQVPPRPPGNRHSTLSLTFVPPGDPSI